MYDPISVATAVVSSGGDLLIQLTDGNIINAGRVRGNPGPRGEKGEDGIRGAAGKDGIDGTNGAKWHTGVGAPELGLGDNGDLYMDVAAAVLPIYQKVNGDWMFLANLKGGGTGGGVGATGEGAAGGGSAVIIKPGPIPPTNDNEGGAVSPGDLWWDSTTGLIYINTLNGWIPISDHPPIIVSPDPPDFTNNSDPTDPNKRYAVREGDAWFDTDQAALYVAVKNVDDDLVWVISTPADRSILQEEIPVGGFIFPATTQDGDTVFNDTTGLWYVYNGAKNQWIDLPPGERELSYPGILRQADPAIDESYEGEADAADGDIYLNAADHEAGTRLVIRKVDRKGFTWTDFIQGLISGDGIALVQTNYDNGPDNPQTQRVDYLIVSEIVENADSFSIEVDYEHQNLDHDPLFGEEVSVRFLAQVSSPAVCVDFSEGTPEPKCVGHLWFDSSEDDYTLYLYDGNEWVPAAPPVSLEGIEQSITGLASAIDELKTITTRQGTDIADAQSTLYGFATALQQQGNQIIELEEEIESIAPSLDRGKWNLHEDMPLSAGQYAMGVAVDSGYCIDQLERCMRAIPGFPDNNAMDPAAIAECNRIAGDCETAKNNGELLIADWAHAAFLHFHKTDSEGKTHTFADYKVGMFIDLFDQGDTGYAVFEITAEPELDNDVYTIGVTPVQHEGEAAGLARVKVFELAGADVTDFVRKTGDTMSGALNVIVESGNAAYIKSGSTDTASVFYVRNGDSKTLFRVKGTGNVQAGPDEDHPFIATDANDVTTKKFVDDAINAALTAPARFEWKVFVNLDGTPQQGLAYLNGASMSDTTVIRVHKQALNASVPIKGHSAGLTMFKYSPSPKLYYSTILSAWSYSSSGWQWKGTAEVEEVKLFADYIQIKLGSHRWANMNFSNTGDYRFTVGGLF